MKIIDWVLNLIDCKRQLEEMENFILEEGLCNDVFKSPSKKLLRRYGLRKRNRWWAIWNQLEQNIENGKKSSS